MCSTTYLWQALRLHGYVLEWRGERLSCIASCKVLLLETMCLLTTCGYGGGASAAFVFGSVQVGWAEGERKDRAENRKSTSPP